MVHTTVTQEDGGAEDTRHSEKVCCKAVVPLHVTGFWVPYILENPLQSGSIGAGLVIEPPVTAVASLQNDRGPRLNIKGLSTVIETLKRVMEWVEAKCPLKGLQVEINVPRPLGVGYAVSGSMALAAALAVACVCGLPFEEAARAAHVAEVVSGTGLGDVIAVYQGRMLEVRLVPGAPSLGGRLISLPFPYKDVVTAAVRRMETRRVHETMAYRVALEGLKAFAEFIYEPTAYRFLEKARYFSLKLGFVDPGTAKALDRALSMGLAVGWYLKKGVLVAVPEKGLERDLAAYLEKLKLGKVYIDRVSAKPAGVEWCDEDT